MDRSYIERNQTQTARLRALTACTDTQLAQPLGDHWTVGAALAHLGYWDLRGIGALEAWRRYDLPLVFWRGPEGVNDARLPIWRAMAPREALEQTIRIAEALDALVAGLSDAEAAVVAARYERMLERGRHRNDHLTEIEQALRH